MLEISMLAAFIAGMFAGFWIERTRGEDLERAARITGAFREGAEDFRRTHDHQQD